MDSNQLGPGQAAETSARSRMDREDELPFAGKKHIYLAGLGTILGLGLNWPVMAVGVSLLPPLWLSTLRLVGGGLCIAVGLAVTGRLQVPARRDYPVLMTVTLVRLSLVTGLVFAALQFVPAGRSSVLVWAAVLWTAVMARWFLHEPISPIQIIGVVGGAVGVVVLMAPWSFDWSDRNLVIGHLMLLGASLAQAIGTVHIRGHRWSVSPVALMPWQLLGAGTILALAAISMEGPPPTAFTAAGVGVVAYQILIGTVVGFYGTLILTRNLPATTSQLMLMAVPAIGVGSSVLLLAEPLTLSALLGMLLVFFGAGASLFSENGVRARS